VNEEMGSEYRVQEEKRNGREAKREKKGACKNKSFPNLSSISKKICHCGAKRAEMPLF